jgi:hypothetical protein
MLTRKGNDLEAAHQLEVTLHALVGRGDLRIAATDLEAPPAVADPEEYPWVFWKPDDRDRVEPAPRDGWTFLENLALHYFRTAGPATRDDLAWWLDISYAAARRTIEDLAGTLEEVDIAGQRQAHFMIEEHAAELRSAPRGVSRRVALLAGADPEARWSREGFLRIVDPDLAFWLAPRGKAARGGRARIGLPVFVGGNLAGAWRKSSRTGEVQVEFIKPHAEDIVEEAHRRADWLATLWKA